MSENVQSKHIISQDIAVNTAIYSKNNNNNNNKNKNTTTNKKKHF